MHPLVALTTLLGVATGTPSFRIHYELKDAWSGASRILDLDPNGQLSVQRTEQECLVNCDNVDPKIATTKKITRPLSETEFMRISQLAAKAENLESKYKGEASDCTYESVSIIRDESPPVSYIVDCAPELPPGLAVLHEVLRDLSSI